MDNFIPLHKLKKKNERYKNILLIVKIKQHIELQNIHHMIQGFFFENVELFLSQHLKCY